MSWLVSGWQVFAVEPAVEAWLSAARPVALAAAAKAERRHGGTWGVGVDALDNDSAGRVVGGPAFGGAAFEAALGATALGHLHRAQISVMYPGYPGRDPGESDAAHRFRALRDAAHLDGLLPEGPAKRRHLREPHGWILGVALTRADPDAAPLVVWEGSHLVIRSAFTRAFAGVDPGNWGDEDVTDIYQSARAEVFDTCLRVAVLLMQGQTVLLHRMLIHGVAPWAQGAQADPGGRAIAYFRPCFADARAWLEAP